MSAAPITPQQIPAAYHNLLERPLLMNLATSLPDGPRLPRSGSTPPGRLKERTIRQRPYGTMLILDPDNGQRFLAIRGPIIEIDQEHDREHIDQLVWRYWPTRPDPAALIRSRPSLCMPVENDAGWPQRCGRPAGDGYLLDRLVNATQIVRPTKRISNRIIVTVGT